MVPGKNYLNFLLTGLALLILGRSSGLGAKAALRSRLRSASYDGIIMCLLNHRLRLESHTVARDGSEGLELRRSHLFEANCRCPPYLSGEVFGCLRFRGSKMALSEGS